MPDESANPHDFFVARFNLERNIHELITKFEQDHPEYLVQVIDVSRTVVVNPGSLKVKITTLKL